MQRGHGNQVPTHLQQAEGSTGTCYVYVRTGASQGQQCHMQPAGDTWADTSGCDWVMSYFSNCVTILLGQASFSCHMLLQRRLGRGSPG